MKDSWWSRLWSASPRNSSSRSVEEVARAILSAPPALYKALEENLGGHRIETDWFIEFASEVCCYILHVLDRTLSDIASPHARMELMDGLVLAISREHRVVLDTLGFEVTDDQVMAIFGEMYTTRQLEYGDLREDWFAQVAVSFGRHAADALEVPEQAPAEVALTASLLAPAVFKDLLPHMQPLLKAAGARK